MSTDPINALRGTTFCPVCGCIEKSGSVRCAKCGTFQSFNISPSWLIYSCIEQQESSVQCSDCRTFNRDL